MHDVEGVGAVPDGADCVARQVGGTADGLTVRSVPDDEADDRRLDGMRDGYLLDEDSRPFLGPESGDKDGGEGAFVDAQLGAHGSPVANGGIARDAVGNHSDGVSVIAIPDEVLPLSSVDGDDGCRTRPHRSQQHALVAPVPP